MKERLYQLVLTVLLLALFILFARAAFSQKPEAALGSYPLPHVVGMTLTPLKKLTSPITIDVYPKFILPISPQTIRVRWRIVRDSANRHYSMSWSSPVGESGSTFRSMDGERAQVSYEWFVPVTVGPYRFEACVYLDTGKKKCVQQTVRTLGEEP
jgi:hypothetical protein